MGSVVAVVLVELVTQLLKKKNQIEPQEVWNPQALSGVLRSGGHLCDSTHTRVLEVQECAEITREASEQIGSDDFPTFPFQVPHLRDAPPIRSLSSQQLHPVLTVKLKSASLEKRCLETNFKRALLY